MISEMRECARCVVISMLPPVQWQKGVHCLEWVMENGSDTPWNYQFLPEQIEHAPGEDTVNEQWIASVWDEKKGRPHKCLERPAALAIVPSLRRIG